MLLNFSLMAQDIKLPPPQKSGGKSLAEALNNRQTRRDFSDKMLDNQQLSNLLWSAAGINREKEGKRTAPTARNMQHIEIYVFMPSGYYLYQPKEHALKLIKNEDLRAKVGMQPFVKEAPVLLVFVANYDKMGGCDADAKALYGATDCGNVSQNVYLYCAAENLSTVALGSIHRDYLQKLLGFNGKAILGQPVGFPK